jgi:hypothetical protein
MAGLFGNDDDSRVNDFVFPNGTLLPYNSTEKEIYAYGETCMSSLMFLDSNFTELGIII